MNAGEKYINDYTIAVYIIYTIHSTIEEYYWSYKLNIFCVFDVFCTVLGSMIIWNTNKLKE